MNSDTFAKIAIAGATKICEFKDFVPDDAVICPAATSEMEQSLFGAVTRYMLGSEHMCSQVLGVCENPHYGQIDLKDVVKEVLSTKPASLENDNFINNLYTQMEADSSERGVIRAVQIADVHLDTLYKEGTKADCDSFLCCRSESGMASSDERAAGQWGDTLGKCDLPVKTFESLIDFAVHSAEIAPDMIIWTGDNSSHNIWNNSDEEVTRYTEMVTNMIKDAVKDTDITVLPIHGNHDTWPVDE